MEKQEKHFKEVKGVENIWNPKEQKEIEGNFIREENGTYGKNFVLKCPSGEEFLIFGSTVLSSKISNIELGSYVKITFLGEVKSAEGRMYKDFKIEVESKSDE